MSSARPFEAGAGRHILAALCGLLCALGFAEARALAELGARPAP